MYTVSLLLSLDFSLSFSLPSSSQTHFCPYSTDEAATESILKAQLSVAWLCGRLGLVTPRDAFITALCKASLPPHYALTLLSGAPSLCSKGKRYILTMLQFDIGGFSVMLRCCLAFWKCPLEFHIFYEVQFWPFPDLTISFFGMFQNRNNVGPMMAQNHKTTSLPYMGHLEILG